MTLLTERSPHAQLNEHFIWRFVIKVARHLFKVDFFEAKPLQFLSSLSRPCARFCSSSCFLNQTLIFERARCVRTSPRLSIQPVTAGTAALRGQDFNLVACL